MSHGPLKAALLPSYWRDIAYIFNIDHFSTNCNRREGVCIKKILSSEIFPFSGKYGRMSGK